MKLRRHTLKIFLPVLVLALGVSGFFYLKSSRPEQPKPKPKEKVWQVAVIEAKPQTLSPTLTLYGETESPSLLQAAAPGAGLVTELLVRKGSIVSEGQRLLALDQRDFTLAVAQAQAEVDDLEAQLTDLELRHQSDIASIKQERRLLGLAQAEIDREKSLRQQNLSSESALDEARDALGRQELAVIARQTEIKRFQTSRSQLEARLQRNRAKLTEAELALERSQVIAPFDGVIASVPVAVGDRVQTGKVLLTLYPIDGLEVRARIPIRYQAEIQQALARDESLLAHAEIANQSVTLELVRLAGEADPSGIDGFFGILQGADQLRLGNLLKLHLQRPKQHNLVPVPYQAVYGNSRIYLFRDGRMQGIDVETVGQYISTQDPTTLLIRSPEIHPGDKIIQTHLPNAVSGLKVKAANS